MAVTDDIGWVAVDLDGTLAETVWPDPGIGAPILAMVELVRTLRHEGNRIAIYTSRSWWDAPRIERWAYLHDIPFDTVVCGKFLASTYIDDRAWNPGPPRG